jgi:dTDP-4-amino-4,6-dideoxygalactose transaminase
VSFFPAKPLGCYGDGGAIFTDDDGLAEIIRSLRVHGQGSDKYDNVRIGITGRLDSVQAAVLLEKLTIFTDEIDARQEVAQRYAQGLADVANVPQVPDGYLSVWAQYTIRVAPNRRDALATSLKQSGIPTAIYYPIPLHRQVAYRHYPVADGGLPVSEQLAAEVISLPMHPYLDAATQDRIIDAVRHALRG